MLKKIEILILLTLILLKLLHSKIDNMQYEREHNIFSEINCLTVNNDIPPPYSEINNTNMISDILGDDNDNNNITTIQQDEEIEYVPQENINNNRYNANTPRNTRDCCNRNDKRCCSIWLIIIMFILLMLTIHESNVNILFKSDRYECRIYKIIYPVNFMNNTNIYNCTLQDNICIKIKATNDIKKNEHLGIYDNSKKHNILLKIYNHDTDKECSIIILKTKCGRDRQVN